MNPNQSIITTAEKDRYFNHLNNIFVENPDYETLIKPIQNFNISVQSTGARFNKRLTFVGFDPSGEKIQGPHFNVHVVIEWNNPEKERGSFNFDLKETKKKILEIFPPSTHVEVTYVRPENQSSIVRTVMYANEYSAHEKDEQAEFYSAPPRKRQKSLLITYD